MSPETSAAIGAGLFKVDSGTLQACFELGDLACHGANTYQVWVQLFGALDVRAGVHGKPSAGRIGLSVVMVWDGLLVYLWEKPAG